MGTVYKAHDPHLTRTVALKVPRFDTPTHDQARLLERFQREVRSAAQVWHPHVCPIYDVGEQDGQPFVVMAYVEGQSLAERLAQHGRFEDVGEAIGLILQILDALGAVHGHGIIHRDLKPSNIMLDAGGRAVLTDFGLARPEAEAGHLTTEGSIVGTPAYMAPEQASGQIGRMGPWTDLYSVGVVLFQIVTGRLPFDGPPQAILGQILHNPPPPLSAVRPYLDVRLERILLQALAKEPEGRFRSAREFGDALRALAGAPTQALPQTAVSAEELVPRSPPVKAAGPSANVSLILTWILYLLPVGLFTLAGMCVVIGLITHDKDAFAAMLWIAGLGAVLLGLLVVRRWSRQHDLIMKNRQGETWLMLVARTGHTSRVKDLLARGAEVNEKDYQGQTALMKAAKNGHTAVVKLLLTGGAEPNEKDNDGQTALMKATAGGHAGIVDLLRAAGGRG
jgi:hypothetical protein